MMTRQRLRVHIVKWRVYTILIGRKTEEDRLAAEKRFPIIAAAYETLRDEAARKEYDYFLDNPEAMYYHYYQYYKRRYSPKVDVRIVAAVIITFISAFQVGDVIPVYF